MKFYYDDTLIRTSKAHIYTHAIVFPGAPGSGKRWAVHSCHHSLAAAESAPRTGGSLRGRSG